MALSGFSPELLNVALWVFAFGLLIASRDLGWRAALPVAAIKVAIPLAYFAWNAGGALHFNDDLEYYYRALHFMRRGYDFSSLFTDPYALPVFLGSIGSAHVGYDFWNLAALSAFGPYYHVPVFFNVGLTFVAGFLFARILDGFGFSRAYRCGALVFFLLHWDILAWSSFLNLKDMLGVTLLLALLHQLLSGLRSGGARAALHFTAAALFATAFAYVRFYVPFLVAAALPLYAVSRRRYGVAAVLLALGAAGAVWQSSLLATAGASLQPMSALSGLLRILVTPLPWNVRGGYEFLFLPSLFDLLLLAPALMALPSLWRAHPRARLVLIFFALALLLYAAAPSLQGPRQRFQVGFVFIWLQYHALRALIHRVAASTKARAEAEPALP